MAIIIIIIGVVLYFKSYRGLHRTQGDQHNRMANDLDISMEEANETTPIIRRNSLYQLYLANQNYFEAMANRMPRESENFEMVQVSHSA